MVKVGAIFLGILKNIRMPKVLSKTTSHEIMFCVQEFINFLEINHIQYPNQCESKILHQYYEFLTNRSKRKSKGLLKGSTPNHHLYAINLLFTWLFNVGAISLNPTLGSKFPKSFSKKVEALSVSQIQKLFDACATDLERAVLSVYYGCGLRRHEGQELLLSDIDFNKWIIVVRKGKYNKRREVPIADSMKSCFSQFKEINHTNLN
jgi:integrase/recombinase XerD